MNADFGPGHLPKSTSQGVESEYIQAFWGRLTNEKRITLEQALRGLPLTQFSCLEKILQHLETHTSSCDFWNRLGRQWTIRDLSTCSPERLKAYLMILTTPGRDYANLKTETKSPMHAIRYQGVDDIYNKSHYCHIEDVEVREAGEKVAGAGENADWINLQRAVQKLPVELKFLIRDTMLKEIFGPGKQVILPYDGSTYLQHFRALDRRLHEKYSHIYYCENMWVIREGSVRWLIKIKEGPIPRVLLKIKNVTLKWTWRDAMNSAPTRPFIQEYIDCEMQKGGADGFDNLEVMEDFAGDCMVVVDELLITWSDRLYQTSSLQLDTLVIDAREAFAPDGEFLGLAAAHRWTKHVHRPRHLYIWTPNDDKDLAEQMYGIIVEKYS